MATLAKSPVLAVLVIALVVSLSCGTCPPVPSVTSISPDSATAGGDQFLLIVSGSEFRRDATVKWNGASRVTTFVSAHQLSATINAADIAHPGTVLISVFNSPEGSITYVSGAIGAMSTSACSGKNSNAVSFTVSP